MAVGLVRLEPMEDKNGQVTRLLLAWKDGDESALDELMPLVMGELRRIAKAHMDKERPDHTLRPTELVQELYLRLVDLDHVNWRNRDHFFGTAAGMMRRTLVDYARRRLAGKRGDGIKPSPIDELFDRAEVRPGELIDLDDALEDLSRIDERKRRAVEMSYFGGLTHQEIGEVLKVSGETVRRDIRLARAWLLHVSTASRRSAETPPSSRATKGLAPRPGPADSSSG